MKKRNLLIYLPPTLLISGLFGCSTLAPTTQDSVVVKSAFVPKVVGAAHKSFVRSAPEASVAPSIAAQIVDPLPPTIGVMSPEGVGWFAIRDQSVGLAGDPPGSGTGSFLTFQSKNSAGVWGDWAALNGGLVDKTPGAEQGDIDFIVVTNGKVGGFAVQGSYLGNFPSILPVVDNEMTLGRDYSRFKNLYLSNLIYLPRYSCPAGIPGNPSGCIRVNADGVILNIPGWVSK